MSDKTFHQGINDSLDASDGLITLQPKRVHVVRSNTDSGEYHCVLEFPLGELACIGGSKPCRGFKYRDKCEHVNRVRREAT